VSRFVTICFWCAGLGLAWLRGTLLALNSVLITYFMSKQLGWPLPLCAWLVSAWGAWAISREWKRSHHRRRTRVWQKTDPGANLGKAG